MQTEQQLAVVPQSGAARFLDACHHRQPDATPVWFMRQAGRCIAEYRELRKRYDILTMAKTPELCAQVTLMPVEKFGVDGAVLYADIMLPLEGMGISLAIQPDIGPIIHNPVRTMQDVAALRVPLAEESTPYVMEAIRLVRRELAGKQAVIGFSGAPFTLASYLIEGRPSRDYAIAKGLMFSQPEVWHALMDKLTEVVSRYLVAQIQAGVDVVQLFDSWVGVLGPTRLLAPWEVIEEGMNDVLRRAANRPGHIFNLGHGVPASTPSDMLRRLVDAVHEASARVNYREGQRRPATEKE